MGQNVRRQWYAVRVRSEHEDVVARQLRVRGLETFLPLYSRQHRDSDQFREVELPLFPGYVLCQFDPVNRLAVLTVPGVVHLVGAGNRPLPIDETEIAAMQAATRSGLPTQPWPFLETGQKVRIEYGPLCGIEGILLGFRSHQRLVLSITLLQRSVAVEITGERVGPLYLKSASSGKPAVPESFPSVPVA